MISSAAVVQVSLPFPQGYCAAAWDEEYVSTYFPQVFGYILTPYLPDQICNSPYCRPYNSYNVSLDNLVLDQLIISKFYFSLFSSRIWLILYWYCKEKFCLGHSWELKD